MRGRRSVTGRTKNNEIQICRDQSGSCEITDLFQIKLRISTGLKTFFADPPTILTILDIYLADSLSGKAVAAKTTLVMKISKQATMPKLRTK